jgi:hypothetical protein
MPCARVTGSMARPQPGQKAAASGIEAAQWGQVMGMFFVESVAAHLIRR